MGEIKRKNIVDLKYFRKREKVLQKKKKEIKATELFYDTVV